MITMMIIIIINNNNDNNNNNINNNNKHILRTHRKGFGRVAFGAENV